MKGNQFPDAGPFVEDKVSHIRCVGVGQPAPDAGNPLTVDDGQAMLFPFNRCCNEHLQLKEYSYTDQT